MAVFGKVVERAAPQLEGRLVKHAVASHWLSAPRDVPSPCPPATTQTARRRYRADPAASATGIGGSLVSWTAGLLHPGGPASRVLVRSLQAGDNSLPSGR